MAGPWKLRADNFDGGRFKERYGLEDGDFYLTEVLPLGSGIFELHLAPGVTIPDDPPIFESSFGSIKIVYIDPDMEDRIEYKRLKRQLTNAQVQAIKNRLGADRVERI